MSIRLFYLDTVEYRASTRSREYRRVDITFPAYIFTPTMTPICWVQHDESYNSRQLTIISIFRRHFHSVNRYIILYD